MVEGKRRSVLRPTRQAKDAEADLVKALGHEVAQDATEEAMPGTLRDGLRGYVTRPEARGKSPDSIGRARQVEAMLAAALPAGSPAQPGHGRGPVPH
jgi:hypothetical protein